MRLIGGMHLRQPRLGKREPEQQAVVAAVILDQRNDFRRSSVLEEKIGIRGEQIRIARVERKRVAELRVGGRLISAAPGDLG